MEKKENGSLPHTTYKNQLQKDKEPKKPDTQLCWQRSSSQSYGFSSSHVRMWELDHKEGWAPKNWCFQTVVLEKTLRVHWTARRSNQSILKETSTEYSLEGLMLKLKLQYCGHLMWRADSLEETLLLGKIEGRRRRGQLRMRWLDTDSVDISLSKPAIHRVTKSQTQLSNWTTTSLPPGYSKLCAMVLHSGLSSYKRQPISKITLSFYSCHMNISDATAKC